MNTQNQASAIGALARSHEAQAAVGAELELAHRSAAKILAAAANAQMLEGLSTDEVVARINGGRDA